jgi:hypothetical protein
MLNRSSIVKRREQDLDLTPGGFGKANVERSPTMVLALINGASQHVEVDPCGAALSQAGHRE